ncbi:MAG: hypothetical protein Q8M20_12560 [Rhodocyclaceae bacterium]|nr:hypothetical protein [Rhodocyclaceae bacterium]MDZ4213834.1 hypothetical protein [Rhodocyclaceae bacterium]
MPTRCVLLLDPAGLSLYQVGGSAVNRGEHFPADESGYERFAHFLRGHDKWLYTLLADVAEEGFQLEDIPFSSGKDRAAIIKRKLGQYYYGTPFSLARSEGRLKQGRRDERLLLMALTQPQTLDPWLLRLDEAQVALQGIYSLPQLAAQLLSEDASAQQLLIAPTPAGLRQVFFDHRQLRLSRQTPLATGSAQETAIATATEAGKMHQYLAGQRLIDRQKPLAVRVVAHPDQVSALRERCQDTDTLHFDIIDLLQESTRLGLRKYDGKLHAGMLFCHLLVKKSPSEQFALPAQRRFFRLWQIRFTLNTVSALILAGGLLFATKLFLDTLDFQTEIQQIEQQTRLDQQRYDATLEALPKIPLTTDNLRALVTRFEAESRRAQGMGPTLAQLSQSMERFPDISLDKLEWQLLEKLEVTTAVTPFPGSTTLASLGSGPFAQLTINARLPVSLASMQTAQIDRVNAFFQDLAQTPDTVVLIQQMPVDAQSTTTLKSDQERGTPEAPRFAFRLIRKL